jgi:hypothetical protein
MDEVNLAGRATATVVSRPVGIDWTMAKLGDVLAQLDTREARLAGKLARIEGIADVDLGSLSSAHLASIGALGSGRGKGHPSAPRSEPGMRN